MPVVQVENVTRDYTIGEVTTRALRGVALEIENGEFTTLVGPSGSGKTTLLQLIGCLDQPTSGRILINGQDVSRLNRNQRADIRRNAIGFIFQFFALIPTLSAYENVEMPLLLRSTGATERRQRVLHLLEEVDLADRADHRPDQLSGGQQQRVAIARSLANDPQLILADEPTGNLDTSSGAGIMRLLAELHRSGRTVVVVTHDVRMTHFATQTVRLIDGQVVSEADYEAALARLDEEDEEL